MASNFPTSLDSASEQPSPVSGTGLDDAGFEHDVVHTNHSTALIAVETKVGIGSSTPVADSVLAGSATGVSGWDTAPSLLGLTVDTSTLVVDATNNRVGIGTSTPETDLHITNASAFARIHLAGSSTGYTHSDIRLDTSDSSRGAGIYIFNSADDKTWFAGSLYGASDTWGVCRVSNAVMQQSAASSGNLLFQVGPTGACYNKTGTYGTISDERLKSDITTARQYTADLAKLRVVNYSLTQRADTNEETGEVEITPLEEPSGKLLGLIAQEVEKVFPAMVDTGSDGIKSVKTSVLVPMMLTAIQELTARIETLETV